MADLENESLIKELLQEAPRASPEENFIVSDDLYTFISVDLTNSTKFKVDQPNLWRPVIAAFYDSVFVAYGVNQYESLLKSLSGDINIEFWKFVGDEVLLYANVHSYSELHMIVKSTDEALKKIIDWIAEKIASSYGCQNSCSESSPQCCCPFNDSNCPSSCRIEDILKGSVGVKATVWLALCGSQSRNIVHRTASATDDLLQDNTFDFLGPEIDEGFRIAKYAVKNRVLVSPLLANVLHRSANENDDIKTVVENHFAIVSYQKLKGIWQDRFFPIVMYSPLLREFHTKFDYDEIELPTYSEIRMSGIEGDRCKVSYLMKILKDVQLDRESDLIVNLLKNDDGRLNKKNSNQFMKIHVEIHVACAIFNGEGQLMARYHERRGWEFGCVQVSSMTTTWKDAIVEGYKRKYAINICVSENPIPIATYTYSKSQNNTALGLIVIGKLQSSNNTTSFIPMSLQQINDINDMTVDSFKENSRKAFSIYNGQQNNGIM